MNQVFTKKKLAAALTLAFATGGAAVLAVAPVPGLVAAAQANEFADTTFAVGQSSGVNVPVSSSATVTGQTISIVETTTGALQPGQIILTPSTGKFVSATQAASSSGTALTLQPIQVDSNGNLILSISAAGSGAVSTITVSAITLDTSAVSTGTAVNVTVSSSSTTTGLTKGSTALLANVTAPGVTTASAVTSAANVTKVAGGQTLTMDQFNVTEAIGDTFKNNATVGADVTIELPSGFTWATAPTMGTLSGTDVTNGGTANTAGNKLSSTGTGYAKASYYFDGDSTAGGASAVKFSGGTVFVPSGTAAGDLNVTVTVYRSNAVLSTSTVKIGQIVTAGATAAFLDATGATATADYNTLFAGRNYAAGITGGVGAENDQIKLTEAVAASLAKNGSVTTALSTGKFGAAPTAAVTSTLTLGAGTLSSDSKTATFLVTSNATTTAGSATFSFGNLDMTTATAGDLNVVMGGTAGVTGATVKLAEVKNATTTTVTGATQTVTGNTVITVPTMTIAENKYAAYVANDVIGIDFPAGYTIQKAGSDASDGASLTNGTDVTVKVTDTAGNDVTSTALGAAPTITTGNGVSGTVRQMFIKVVTPSATAAGAYTFTISGLKVKTSATATAGDINAVIAGADGAGGTSTAAAMGAEDSATWTSKASATKQTVKVGSIVAATVPSIPAATVTGTTSSQTIDSAVVASGNDQGKLGTLYVAAVLPSSIGGGVYLKNSSGAWVAYNPASPAYFASPVTLGTHTANVVSATDLSGIIGTNIYVGYGVGTTDFGITAPWNSMLNNGTYNLVYTVK